MPRQHGEDCRVALLEKGQLNPDLKIDRDNDYIYIPITVDEVDRSLKRQFKLELTKFDFLELEKEPKSYKEIVEIPDNLRELLPSSFDVIGNIAIIKIPDELHDHKEAIGKAVMAANKSCASVAMDKGVEGDLRIRNLETIAGRTISETTHREYGMDFLLDPSKVYFSPRLATERHRLTELVQDGEIVTDMFTGVGPFAISLAMTGLVEHVFAIDLNEDAIDYLKQNIDLNGVDRIVEPVYGDAKFVVTSLEPADRIVMNLPHSAFDFIEEAIHGVKPGGVIHYYEIMEDDKLEDRLDEIMDIAEQRAYANLEVEDVVEVRTYSPTQKHFAVDLRVIK